MNSSDNTSHTVFIVIISEMGHAINLPLLILAP